MNSIVYMYMTVAYLGLAVLGVWAHTRPLYHSSCHCGSGSEFTIIYCRKWNILDRCKLIHDPSHLYRWRTGRVNRPRKLLFTLPSCGLWLQVGVSKSLHHAVTSFIQCHIIIYTHTLFLLQCMLNWQATVLLLFWFVRWTSFKNTV